MESGDTETDDEFDVDSLFDSASPLDIYFPEIAEPPHPTECTVLPLPVVEENGIIIKPLRISQRNAPPIPGLFFNPDILLPKELEERLISQSMKYFGFKSSDSEPDGKSIINNNNNCNINQAMLFGRTSNGSSGLPPFLDELIVVLASMLEPYLPMETYEMLFPQNHQHDSTENTRKVIPTTSIMSRQAILNHYFPGEGITPHVDLLRRFADGIIGISLGSGTAMTFKKVVDDHAHDSIASGEELELDTDTWELYLPERSIIVLTKDARYKWTHGIEGQSGDYVLEDDSGMVTWIGRGTRISITLRWLLPGADVVGE